MKKNLAFILLVLLMRMADGTTLSDPNSIMVL
jgi:hypothetical protein